MDVKDNHPFITHVYSVTEVALMLLINLPVFIHVIATGATA